MPRFNPSTVYKLPKEIGEIAVQLMRDGTEPATALGTARMLSNNPQDPAAAAFVSDLVRRSDKARVRARDMYNDSVFNRSQPELSDRSVRVQASTLAKRPSSRLSGSMFMPEEVVAPIRGMVGAESRIYAEAALSASQGNADVFRQNLLDLGFAPDAAEELVRRYTPTIIRQEPDAMGLL